MHGSVTQCFLFTDIEGSTRRWESDRAAMSAALARHDAILRNAIESHAGTVFKTVGDAFCAAFGSAADATASAIAAQRALAAEDWSAFGAGFTELRVRMAIHAGEAEQRDADWFGPPLNRVARLLAAGHGGQVLVSQSVHALLGARLAEGTALHDLGTHRLKDLREPERVFQLAAPGLASSFPALVSLDARPNNLPAQLDSFVGRSEEMAQLHTMLGDPAGPRLVTLTGTGGTGKTRLAVQAAADLVDRFEHGAWLVELAPLASGAAIGPAIVLSLGLRDEPARDPIESLAGQIADRRLLLLLDNCEHLVESVADLTFRLLRSCPSLRILATSREALSVTGERCLPLGPLPSPRLGSRRVEVVGQSAAVRLFVDRARSARPDFQLDAANAPAIAELCHCLDGIPLALELAAARVRSLAPEQINARLGDRLRFLTGGGRHRPSRQQTLRATLDWSYELLTPIKQEALASFSVFSGAVPLEAAEAVCTADDHADFEVLDALDGLVAHSLLAPVQREGATWYRLLETVRLYAAEKLIALGWERATRQRHLAWYRTGIDTASDIDAMGPRMDAEVERLRPLAIDLEVALRRMLDVPEDADAALDLIEAGWWLFFNWGGLIVGTRLQELLASTRPPITVASARPCLFWLLGGSLLWTGNPSAALPWFDAAGHGFAALGDRRREAWAIQEAGSALKDLDKLDEAEDRYLEALAIKHELADPIEIFVTLLNFGELARLRTEYERAATFCSEALELLPPSERLTQRGAWVQHNLAQCWLRLGDPVSARRAWNELLRIESIVENPLVTASSLAGMAALAAIEGRSIAAGRLLGAAESALEATKHHDGGVLEQADLADWQLNHSVVIEALEPDQLEQLVMEGRALDHRSAIALAKEWLADDSRGDPSRSRGAGEAEVEQHPP